MKSQNAYIAHPHTIGRLVYCMVEDLKEETSERPSVAAIADKAIGELLQPGSSMVRAATHPHDEDLVDVSKLKSALLKVAESDLSHLDFAHDEYFDVYRRMLITLAHGGALKIALPTMIELVLFSIMHNGNLAVVIGEPAPRRGAEV